MSRIVSGSFNGISFLREIIISENVSTIESLVFSFNSFDRFIVEAGNLNYSSLDDVLFSFNQDTLVKFPERKGGNYSMPTTVTTIDSLAFEITSLETLNISEHVNEVGSLAFRGTYSLQNVVWLGDAPEVVPTEPTEQIYNGANSDIINWVQPGAEGWGDTFQGRPVQIL